MMIYNGGWEPGTALCFNDPHCVEGVYQGWTNTPSVQLEVILWPAIQKHTYSVLPSTSQREETTDAGKQW